MAKLASWDSYSEPKYLVQEFWSTEDILEICPSDTVTRDVRRAIYALGYDAVVTKCHGRILIPERYAIIVARVVSARLARRAG